MNSVFMKVVFFVVVYCKVHSCSEFTAKFAYNSTCFYPLWDFVAQVRRFMTPGCIRCCVKYWRQLMIDVDFSFKVQSNLDYPNTAGPGQKVRINESSDNRGAYYYS